MDDDVMISVIDIDNDEGIVNPYALQELLSDKCNIHRQAGHDIVSIVPITSCQWGNSPRDVRGHHSSGWGGGPPDVLYNYTSALLIISQKRRS